MTALGMLRIGWARKGWIAGSVALTAFIAALLGAMLERRVSYVASRVLAVTEGVHAEAVFACKSAEVLSRALAGSRLEGSLLPQELAESVKVEVEGRFVRLSVERPSASEAEYLVERIASEASRAVTQHANEVSSRDRAAAEEIEERLRQLRANRDAAQRELAELTTSHPVEPGPHGELRSVSRRRLIETQDSLAAARRELAELDAELAAMRGRSASPEPPPEAPPRAPGGESPRGRPEELERLDRRIAELREEMTDLHPRLAALLAERARLEEKLLGRGAPAGDSAPGTGPAPSASAEHPELAAKEALRARVAARVSALEKEEKSLSEQVRTEAAAVEERVARMTLVLKRSTDDILSTEQELEQAKRKAAASTASRAALSVRTKLPTEARRSGASATLLGSLGAAFGLVLGVLLAALAEAVDPVLRTAEDVMKHLDLPVLAEVPAGALAASSPARGRLVSGGLLWLCVFVVAAAFLLVLAYPGWETLAELFRRFGSGRASP